MCAVDAWTHNPKWPVCVKTWMGWPPICFVSKIHRRVLHFLDGATGRRISQSSWKKSLEHSANGIDDDGDGRTDYPTDLDAIGLMIEMKKILRPHRSVVTMRTMTEMVSSITH